MKAEEYYIEEYKSLKEELLALVAETRKLETLVAGATAAVYAWFATQKMGFGVPWFIPCILVLLGGLRSFAIFIRVTQIGGYLKDQETRFNVPGWETRLAKLASSKISFTAAVFWGVALLITVLAPFFLTAFSQISTK